MARFPLVPMVLLVLASVAPALRGDWQPAQEVSVEPACSRILGARASLMIESMVWTGGELRSRYAARISPPFLSAVTLYSESGSMVVPVDAPTLQLLQARQVVLLHGRSQSPDGRALHPVRIEVRPDDETSGTLLIWVEVGAGRVVNFSTRYRFKGAAPVSWA